MPRVLVQCEPIHIEVCYTEFTFRATDKGIEEADELFDTFTQEKAETVASEIWRQARELT